jgi:hypothetical protein
MTGPTDAKTLTICADDPIGETAQQLIQALCSEMSERYGRPPSPFSSAERTEAREVFLVARLAGHAVGCGALRRIDDEKAEIKRMYVAPAGRRTSSSWAFSMTAKHVEMMTKDGGYVCESDLQQPISGRDRVRNLTRSDV